MSRERPNPEQKGASEGNVLFNVDVMSDRQIYTVYTRLISIKSRLFEHPDDEPFVDSLSDQLRSAVFDLANRNPDRVRNLVRTYTDDPTDGHHEFAAEMVPALLDHDYEFTRDTLISIAIGDAWARSQDGGIGHDTARDEIRYLMRDRLTPAQVADWQEQYARFEPHAVPTPALPGER